MKAHLSRGAKKFQESVKKEIVFEKKRKSDLSSIQSFFTQNDWTVEFSKKDNSCRLSKTLEGHNLSIIFRPVSMNPDTSLMSELTDKDRNAEEPEEEMLNQLATNFILRFGLYIQHRDSILHSDYLLNEEDFVLQKMNFLSQKEVSQHQQCFLKDQDWITGDADSSLWNRDIQLEMEKFGKSLGLTKEFAVNLKSLSISLEQEMYKTFLSDLDRFFEVDPKLLDK